MTPKTSPIKLHPLKRLTLPLSVTEFPLTPIESIIPTPPPPPHHIPDPSDIEPILLRNFNKPQSRKPILVPTSIKARRRHSQFDPSLPFPKPCKHFLPETSLPPPKPSTIPHIEYILTLGEKYPLSDIDSTTFSLLYPRLPPFNSASKHTTSSLYNLIETSSDFTICRPPRIR